MGDTAPIKDADEKVAQKLGTGDVSEQNRKTMMEIVNMEMQIRKGEKVNAETGTDEQKKTLNNMIAMVRQELRYLYAAINLLRSNEPEARHFRNSVGTGSGNIKVLADALRDRALHLRSDKLLDKTAGSIRDEEDEFLANEPALIQRNAPAGSNP